MRSLASFLLLFAGLSAMLGAASPISPGSVAPSFEENRGQFAADVQHVARHGKARTEVSREGIRFVLGARQVALIPVRARTAEAHGEAKLDTVSHYYAGPDPKQWIEHVPHFAEVVQSQVWPGVGVKHYFAGQDYEFDLVVAAGADPGQARFRVQGADAVEMAADGAVEVRVGKDRLRMQAPEAWQGDRKVASRFLLQNGELSVAVGKYDRARELVIDPRVVFVGFFGGPGFDEFNGVATDQNLAIYATGSSTFDGFPWSQPNRGAGERWGFVTKLESTARNRMYFTHFGGGAGRHVVVEPNGGVYVTGYTEGRWFPATPATYQSPNRANQDAFVARLRPNGTLLFASAIGGNGNDEGTRIAFDIDGNAYVAGICRSTNFPVTPGAYRVGYSGGSSDAFLARVSADGTALSWATLLGGQGTDEIWGMVLDQDRGMIVAGRTDSQDFPTTSGALQERQRGFDFPQFDAFVARIGPFGNTLLFSTYLGGTRYDAARALVRDAEGNLIVGGGTNSNEFPLSPATVKERITDGRMNSFVARLNPNATRILAATALSGVGENELETVNDLRLDPAGNVLVVGIAGATSFPPTGNPYQPDGNGWGYLAYLRSDLRQLSDAVSFGSTTDLRSVAFAADLPNPSGPLAVIVAGASQAEVPTRLSEFVNNAYLGETDGIVGRVELTRPTAPPALVLNARVETAGTLVQYVPFAITYEVTNGLAFPMSSLLIANSRPLVPVPPLDTVTLANPTTGEFQFNVNQDIACAYAGLPGTGFRCFLRQGRSIQPNARITFTIRAFDQAAGSFNNTVTAEGRSSTGQGGTVTTNLAYQMTNTPPGAVRPTINAIEFRGRGPSPGGLNTIFGRWPTSPTSPVVTVAGQAFPYSVEGITVLANNTPVPVLFANDTQINFYLPPNFPLGRTTFQVISSGIGGEPVAREVVPVAPYMFTTTGSRCACQNADGNLNNDFTPVFSGSVLVAYFTGGGLALAPIPNNAPVAGSPLPALQRPAKAFIDGLPATIDYIGFTPGSVGLQQVNVRIPADLPAGLHDLQIEVDSVSTNLVTFVSRRP